MTLTQKIFQTLFDDYSIEKTKGISTTTDDYLISFEFSKDTTVMWFHALLSEKQIIALAKDEFGKDETGLIFDESGYLDMSKSEIMQYLDDNAERLAMHVPEWEIETQID